MWQGEYALWSPHDEAEGYDRTSLRLPGMQEGLLQHLARLTDTPLARAHPHILQYRSSADSEVLPGHLEQ